MVCNRRIKLAGSRLILVFRESNNFDLPLDWDELRLTARLCDL